MPKHTTNSPSDAPTSTIRLPRDTTYACMRVVAVLCRRSITQLVTDAVFPDGVPDSDDVEALKKAADKIPTPRAEKTTASRKAPTRRRRRRSASPESDTE